MYLVTSYVSLDFISTLSVSNMKWQLNKAIIEWDDSKKDKEAIKK